VIRSLYIHNQTLGLERLMVSYLKCFIQLAKAGMSVIALPKMRVWISCKKKRMINEAEMYMSMNSHKFLGNRDCARGHHPLGERRKTKQTHLHMYS